MKNKQKVIEGIVWNDHAGYGMCLLPKGPSVPGDAIIIESEGKQLLPNEWHGMKVRLTIEVINDYVSPEHKKFYDHDLWSSPGHEGDDYPHVCQRCEENGPRCVCVKEIDRIYDYANGEVKNDK